MNEHENLKVKKMVMVLQITVVLIQILELNKYGIMKGLNGKNIIAAMMIVANIIFVFKYGEIFKFIYKKIESISERKKLSRGESAYAPHGSVGEIFHNGIDSKRED